MMCKCDRSTLALSAPSQTTSDAFAGVYLVYCVAACDIFNRGRSEEKHGGGVPCDVDASKASWKT